MKTKNTLNKNTAAGTIYDLLTGNDLRSIGKSNEVVWHIAMMLGYLKLTKKEVDKSFNQLYKWLNKSDSIIVKVMCMQTLADLAAKNKSLIKVVRDEIEKQMINGAPAIKARGRHLLKQIEKLK
ncbi:MAG: hypothetical protein M1391_13905 [Bacteroidetes bacterium]|nr:hypothetical protein [Bacteroidota bacterium]